MARHKKINTVKVEKVEIIEKEVNMSNEAVLENLQTEIDLARSELEKTKLEIEERKQEIQNNAKRDIPPDEMKLVEKGISMNAERKVQQAIHEKQKAYDSQMVTGKFINRRAPGQTVKLTYLKYNEDPVKWYELQDGKIYTIPRGFADQIKDHYYSPKFHQVQGEMNPDKPQSVINEIDNSQKKYDFVPLSF